MSFPTQNIIWNDYNRITLVYTHIKPYTYSAEYMLFFGVLESMFVSSSVSVSVLILFYPSLKNNGSSQQSPLIIIIL